MNATDAPPTWRHNPSAWPRRLPLAGAAALGCAIAIYLMLYQMHQVHTVWEPFFGDGSRRVLTSSVARALPIPDAALGVLGYLLEVGAVLLGGGTRWRTAPLAVLASGAITAAFVLGSLVLVALQAFYFRAGCTLCIASAAISFAVVTPAWIEVVAALGFLRREHARGRSLWQSLHGNKVTA